MDASLSDKPRIETDSSLAPELPCPLEVNSAWRMDVQGFKPRYALYQGNRILEVSEVGLALLTAAYNRAPLAAIAADLGHKLGRNVTIAEVKSGYDHLFQQLTELESSQQLIRPGLWLRVPLLRPSRISAIVSGLVSLFRTSIVISLLIFFSAVLICVFLAGVKGTGPIGFVIAYALFLVSQLIHELGHAAAAKKQEELPGGIGFAMYLMWPAFYVDLNGAWRLPRRKRALVDLGGVYLQFVFAGCCGIIYLVTGWQELSVAIVLILIVCGINLLPAFRLDGYWLLADLLGIQDLEKKARGSFASIAFPRILRRYVTHDHSAFPRHSVALQRILICYGAFSYLTWVFFAIYLVTGLWRYSAQLPSLILQFLSGQPVVLALLLALMSIVPLIVVTLTVLRYGFGRLRTYGK